MKEVVLMVIVVCFLGYSGAHAQENQPVKHALVVAISEYSPASGFRNIFAENDRRLIMKLLQQQGFTDTMVLTNSSATKDGFMKAFAKLQSTVRPGDIVFIHFSTHGQQIADRNRDEPDELDEAIAMYDSHSNDANGYTGQNHLTDDELGSLIGKLRKNLGKDGDILVMIDACHSGSMTRGTDIVNTRGGYPPIMPGRSDYHSRGADDKNDLNPKTGNKARVTETETVGMFSPADQGGREELANYVIFSACENNEVSSEYYYQRTYFGPLTWAFLNAVLSNTSETFTYKKLYHDIQFKMISMFDNPATRQHPTMESAEASGEDRVIFGGRNVAQKPFYYISSFIGDDTILIAGGAISTIFDSTTVWIYPSGTMDPSRAGAPVTKGKVIRSGYLESYVRLDNPITSQKPGNYWVFVAERKFKGPTVRLNFGPFSNAALKKKAAGELNGHAFVEITSGAPAFILKQSHGTRDSLCLEFARSRMPYKENIRPANLVSTLLAIAQAQFLKEMNLSVPGLEMEISLTPLDTTRTPATKFMDAKTMRTKVRAGVDTAVLWIVNTGKKSFYFNVIDIDPEEKITVFLPNADKPVSKCFLKPGEKFRGYLTFKKPYGTEVFKLIASTEKFDLRPVISPAGLTRGTFGDLENIFSAAYQMRGTPSLPESAEMATFSYFFDVVK